MSGTAIKSTIGTSHGGTSDVSAIAPTASGVDGPSARRPRRLRLFVGIAAGAVVVAVAGTVALVQGSATDEGLLTVVDKPLDVVDPHGGPRLQLSTSREGTDVVAAKRAAGTRDAPARPSGTSAPSVVRVDDAIAGKRAAAQASAALAPRSNPGGDELSAAQQDRDELAVIRTVGHRVG